MKILIILVTLTLSLFAIEKNEILLLHSYNKGLKWSDGISNGVNQVFKNYPKYEITTEYMDSKKIDTKEYFDSLLKLYELKFSKREYKAVIVADNYAYMFALKYHDKLFKDTPIVFCGVENFEKDSIPKRLEPLVTGVIEYKDINKNFELISKVIDELDTLYIISDDTLSSNKIKSQILDVVKQFQNRFNIIYDNKIEFDKLTNKVNALPKNSAILFTSLYVDKNKEYIPYSRLREFFNSSKYPVFALNSIHLNEGVVGGVMVDPVDQGHFAATKVIDILSGIKPIDMKIEKPVGKYYFDYEALKKYGLLKANIPTLSTIINRPKDFFERNRDLVNNVFVIVPLLVFMLIGLIIAKIKNTRTEIKLLEQNKLDNVLLNNIKNAIFWESKEGVVLGCNEAFCNFLNLNKDEILNKNILNLLPKNLSSLNIFNEIFEEKELEVKNEEGKYIYLFVRRKQYFDKNEKKAGVVTVISDHTNTKVLEIQKQKDEQFIIQRTKTAEIGEMITSIAHQWKKPLIEISTIVQEMLYTRMKKEVSVEQTKECVEEVMTQVQYMTKTIDNFRSFIKPSKKKTNICIKNSFESLFSVIEHSIKYNYINLKIEYKTENLSICGYENEFKQCIISIINNCIDSIKKRKTNEEIQGVIKVEIYEENEEIFISIKDNGMGIKKENLDKIFDPFFTTKLDGDGFGLYMTKLIIEDKMNGEIRALDEDEGAHILINFKNKSCKDENISS